MFRGTHVRVGPPPCWRNKDNLAREEPPLKTGPHFQRSVYLVSRNRNKLRRTIFLSCIEQNLRAEDIGTDKSPRVKDTTVDMGLSGKINDDINSLLKYSVHCFRVYDIAFDKSVIQRFLYIRFVSKFPTYVKASKLIIFLKYS